MKIIDISRPLQVGTPVWPGDEQYRYVPGLRIADGASVNLGSISLSVHTGTHADAPLHFRDGAIGASEMDLLAFVGPAAVIDVTGLDVIEIESIDSKLPAGTHRVLLRTGAWADPDRFPTSFPVISSGVPQFLKGRGVVLLGVDVPSVDRFDSHDLPNHHSLDACGIRILESLRLDGVPVGVYELFALPLKLVGADGAPVRAVLRQNAAPGT